MEGTVLFIDAALERWPHLWIFTTFSMLKCTVAAARFRGYTVFTKAHDTSVNSLENFPQLF